MQLLTKDASLKFGNSGGVNARLVAHKSKGLPRISLLLSKLMNSSANDATTNFSLALFKAFKDKQNDYVKGCTTFFSLHRNTILMYVLACIPP